jgi:hypothetical protein
MIPVGSHRYNSLKLKIFALILWVLTGIDTIAGGNFVSFPLAICIKNPQKEECTVFRRFFYYSCWPKNIAPGPSPIKNPRSCGVAHRVRCGPGSSASACCKAGLSSYLGWGSKGLVAACQLTFKNPRKFKGKKHSNCPRSEEVTTAIEKNPGKDSSAIVFFCSGSTLIQSGSIRSC